MRSNVSNLHVPFGPARRSRLLRVLDHILQTWDADDVLTAPPTHFSDPNAIIN